jgi:hypothetical protein
VAGKPATVNTEESPFLRWASSWARTASRSSPSSSFSKPRVTQTTVRFPVPADSALGSSVGITAMGGRGMSA